MTEGMSEKMKRAAWMQQDSFSASLKKICMCVYIYVCMYVYSFGKLVAIRRQPQV